MAGANEDQLLNISGILVATRPEAVGRVSAELEALPGVSVHQVDSDGGRIVVTQDLASTEEQTAGLRRIQAIADVLYASLVYHYLGDEDDVGEGD